LNQAQDLLKTYWGHEAFRPQQEAIIDAVLNGKDVVALLPTGGGKSLCFQIPGLMREGITVVISPLVALMQDQVNQLKERNIKAVALTGSQSADDLVRLMDHLRFGGYKFLYLSPERLKNDIVQDALKGLTINLFAIDEAHCISKWGYDFRPAYQQLKILKTLSPSAPILALTATATQEVLNDTISELQLNAPEIFVSPLIKENISVYIEQREDLFDRVLGLIKKQGATGIIYLQSRKKSETLAKQLAHQGCQTQFYHGGMSDADKSKKLQNWLKSESQIMIATSAFGMGIDHPGVRFVIHLHLPESIESYVQEVGRAGRDGQHAQAWLLYQDQDIMAYKSKVLQQNIDLKFVTEFYRSLNNYCQIPYGEGQQTSHVLSLAEFCHHYQYPYPKALAGFNLLDRLGIIQLDQRSGRKSALQFLVSSPTLQEAFAASPDMGLIGGSILRLYGGLFQSKHPVDLYLIAKKTEIPYPKVLKELDRMSQLGLIDFTHQATDTTLTFLVPREDGHTINPHAAIINRAGERRLKQSRQVLDFLTAKDQCLNQLLAQHFGQELAKPCGRCSNCLRNKSNHQLTGAHQIEQQIKKLLIETAMEAKDLKESLNFAANDVDTVLSWLVDKDRVRINAINQYYWNL